MATLQKEIIGNFSTRQEAQDFKQAVESAGINRDQVMINDDVTVYNEVAAQGTTVGSEAGLVTGAFLGGTVGAILAIVQGFYFPTNTLLPGQLVIIGLTSVGAIMGALFARRIRNNHLPEQKLKGNPDIPRRFRVEVSGSDDEIRQARQVLVEQGS
ncbi:hypothetical protein C7271_08125 [filamentous cyanobacterium CCP5]|nr:hypothetical protein C7271_08125 [filamentous cyanobacterium CCP5]